MNRRNRVTWGVLLVVLGGLYALKALNILDFSLFFSGWWTLFIIVPSVVGLFTQRDKMGNLVGIVIGGALLLACQDVVDFRMLWKLIVPAIIVLIGLRLIVGGGRKQAKVIESLELEQSNSENVKRACATFSGIDLNYNGQVFDGAELTAVFGGIQCDLRGAVIEKDCVIKVNTVFGGIDILVDDKVNVLANSSSVFGGIENKTPTRSNVPTVYISGSCVFGGVEIK